MRIAGCEVIGEHESEACRVVRTRAMIRSHCDSCEQLERDTRFGQLPDWKKLIVIKHCIAAVCNADSAESIMPCSGTRG